MAVLIWIGAGLALLGVLGLVWSAVIVMRARQAGLDEAALRARMGRALPLNVGALLLSLLGLMCVVMGVVLA
jgi:uncharacterized iron-regulated membrane protein